MPDTPKKLGRNAELQEKPQKTEFQFESKSDPGHFYKVTVTGEKVDCTCSGRWRAKDRQKGCTHMQQVRKQLNLK